MTNTPAVSSSAPVMRNLFHLQTKRQLVIALALTAVVTTAYKFLFNDPRKAAYAEFYRNYDADKAFERMRAKGHFQSC